LTILEEPRAGKNYALNRAVQIAQGELFVFTDDDVVLPTNFLKGYSELIQQQTDFALFGGSIVPLWGEEPDPRILSEVPMGTAFAATDADRSSGPIPANLLYGPNMAIRRAVFDSGLSFDVSIGPNGGRYVMGDETDLLIRAEAAGFKAYYTPNVVVKHRIRPEQHEISWIERRGYIAGSSMVHNQIRKHGGQLPATKRVAGIPRWALRKALRPVGNVVFPVAMPVNTGAKGNVWRRVEVSCSRHPIELYFFIFASLAD